MTVVNFFEHQISLPISNTGSYSICLIPRERSNVAGSNTGTKTCVSRFVFEFDKSHSIFLQLKEKSLEEPKIIMFGFQ
jgi:hypothetical protein